MNRRRRVSIRTVVRLLAFTLAGSPAGFYLQRLWVAHARSRMRPRPCPRTKRNSFPPAFQKVEGDRTIFDLEASKVDDLRGQDISLLEDVKIKVFGKKWGSQ